MTRPNVRQLLAGVALALSGACVATSAKAETTTCSGIDPPQRVTLSKRAVTPEDLARLRDIGMPGYSLYEQTPFTISLDNRLVAFTLRQGDPTTNSYCHALYVADVRSGHTRRIDMGGEFISYVIGDLRGLVNPSGIPAINTPKWSPDGQWVAYLKRISGVTQVWRVAVDGSAAVQVTHLPIDADAVAWSRDGNRIIFSDRLALVEAREAIDREGLSGYRQDYRVMPLAGPKPFPRAPIPYEYWSIEIATGSVRRANPQERLRLEQGDERRRPAHAQAFAQVGLRRAWIAPRFPSHAETPSDLWSQSGDGPPVRCDAPACAGKLTDVWVSPDDQEVHYLRREGWADSQTALYRWRPGRVPAKIAITDDVLSNCQDAGAELVCARESSLAPIRLVAIDRQTGASRLIFDPNPEFSALRLGAVKRLYWINRYGIKSFGDLVLPPDHRPGERHPLILTQYKTRGFLRGAIGDLYPIQVFAARGFAVLSLDRPERWAQAKAKADDARTYEQFEQENNRNWIDRRNVLSTLLTGLRTVEAMGVDSKRIGITGTSEGAMGLWFALSNTRNVFTAASMGSCCMDPKTLMAVGGDAWVRDLRTYGYPSYLQKNTQNFWRPFSLAVNADHVRIPLLIQVPDDEYGMALETVKSYRESGTPVDFYVFPNEHHNIWQPAHRLAMYHRNVAFFEKWLK